MTGPGGSSGAGQRWLYAALAGFVALLWLATLPDRPLFNPDEGRYAEIPREMLVGGDWVIPRLNGLAYIEKPPLQYWATAISYRLLGTGVFAARLYTALCALGLVALVWMLARRLWDEAAAWRCAAVLASLSLFTILGQLLTLDMSLTFFMTLSLAGFLLAQRGRSPRWMLLAWLAAAAGVLTKGLVAAAIPAAVLVVHTLVTRDTGPWRRLQIKVGLPLFVLATVPWHWLAAARLPDFPQFFFVHEHLARYLTPSADRQEAWWFFGAVFLAGSLPWTLPALRVVFTGWRTRGTPGEFNHGLFLWLWIVFIVGFFSLSDSKLIPYILPAMPAVALLVGALPPATLRRDVVATALLVALAAAALAIAGTTLPHLIPATPRSPYFLQFARQLLPVEAVLAASAAFVLVRRAQGVTGRMVFLGVGWCLAVLLLLRAAAAVGPIYSGYSLAAALPQADRDAPLYSVATYDQTLPFYLARTVRLVAVGGELDYGLRHAPAGANLDLAQFVTEWSVSSRAYAVMEPDTFDELKSRGVPMRETHRDLQRVLVSRQ
ncbi:MAG: phospholipid carrier-dependent glycosyltransferase [Steroidobacterales bacterium]